MRVTPNRLLFFAVRLLISAVSLYLVFAAIDIEQVLPIIRNVGNLYFLSVVLIYIMSLGISTIRWLLLLPEKKFTFWRLSSLYIMGNFFSNFLPGVIPSDVVKAYYFNKDAKKISLTLASIFMDRYLGYASLVGMGILAFLFSMGYFGGSVYKWIMPAIFLAFVIGSFLFFIFFKLKMGRRYSVVSEIYEYLVALKAKKGVIVKAILLSVFVQMMSILSVALLARAMGENIPILLLFVFLPIVITITALPISISGLGVREGVFVLMLGLIGVSPEIAVSLSLCWFFSSFIGATPGYVTYIMQSNRIMDGIGMLGFFIGGFVGFLARPSAFLLGQLPLWHVFSRGAHLKGIDNLMVSFAQQSFNITLIGAIIGACAGITLGYFVEKRETAS